MIGYLEYLNAPTKIGVAIIGFLLVVNLVGELLEFKGKVVPEWAKIRKIYSRHKQERAELRNLLTLINTHYSTENISKRDRWMDWVNERAKVYDESIIAISKNLTEVTQALRDNTKLTEEMFVQSSRDRIIDFAGKVADDNKTISREEFNRIFKVHKQYEEFLDEHGMTNGEIDIAFRVINESYEDRLRHHSFLEDKRGY